VRGERGKVSALTECERTQGSGFSLLEVLVSLALFSLVLIGLHALALSGERTQEMGSRLSKANQDIRAALEIVSRDFRMAGSGFGGLPVQTADGPSRVLLYPILAGCTYGEEADSVRILLSLEGVRTALKERMPDPYAALECKDVRGFAPGDRVVVTDGVSADMFEVTAVVFRKKGHDGKLIHDASRAANDPAGHSVWPPGGYAKGSAVAKVNAVVLRAKRSGDAWCLTRKVDGGEAVPLLANMRKLTLTYRLSDGTLVRDPPPGAGILEVRIELTAGLRSGWGAERRCVEVSTSVRPRTS